MMLQFMGIKTFSRKNDWLEQY